MSYPALLAAITEPDRRFGTLHPHRTQGRGQARAAHQPQRCSGGPFVLKHQPVIDIFTVAIGFVLRVYAGATALLVPVSSWMFVTTLCLALYLAAVKRRQELSQSGPEARKVLGKYSVQLVDRYAEMSATGALVFYSMFVMSTRPQLVITVPLVLFGLFRYWYVVEELDGGESPTDALFDDWQLLLTLLLWVATCAWALWPGKG